MYAKLLRIIYKIENNNVLASVKKGFILLVPVFLLGSFALLIRNFPVAPFQEFLQQGIGETINTVLLYIFNSTVNVMSIYLVISISYYYSETMKEKNTFLQIMAIIVSLVCFVATFGEMELAYFGPIGVFTAIITSVASTKLFFVFYRLISKSARFRTQGVDMDYRNSFPAIFPMLICVLIFVMANLLIRFVFGVPNLNDLITNGIISLFQNLQGDLAVGILYVFVLNFLWMFGVHGGNALENVAATYLVPAIENPDVIVSKSFLDNFALLGGSGAALCLMLALLIFSRGRENRRLARSAAPAVLFNINEILVYGLPTVLNPVMLVPFILTPISSLLIAYGATVMGIIPVVTESVQWTTPVFFSGYLATGSINGILVQLVIVLVGTAIYAPFIRMSERIRQNQADVLLDELTEFYKKSQAEGTAVNLLSRHDSMGILSRNMASQLRSDIEQGNIPLYYQPQFRYDGRMSGTEALLRWKYGDRTVYPPLVVELAQEDGFFDRMTRLILQRAAQDCRILLDNNCKIKVSANIKVDQLNDSRFVNMVIRLVHETGVSDYLGLEITEETSADQMTEISENIHRLRANGVMTAVDDFSMGHTSLKYLQTNDFYSVKLDGSLVREVATNPRSREIIASIVALGQSLNFIVVAEYVETKEIRDELKSLGCDYYQGYYYSPAIPFDDLLLMAKGNMLTRENS